ncbi:hypothetical protein QWZ13_06585 [Reinekea marina]|uniref:hypothetical protein n=1 Tax=Reinekea marina TaxID=1310421 RepID=UPI0025B4A312|nr:hypothetical protein [Reinekea marina]MDN3648576.1 hypothetical protein [Reinekea marina]
MASVCLPSQPSTLPCKVEPFNEFALVQLFCVKSYIKVRSESTIKVQPPFRK